MGWIGILTFGGWNKNFVEGSLLGDFPRSRGNPYISIYMYVYNIDVHIGVHIDVHIYGQVY